MAATPRKIYYFIIVLSLFMLSGAGVGILYNTYGVFVKPVTQELNFTRSAFSLYFCIGSIVSCLTTPIFGWIFKKDNIRLIIAICGLGCALTVYCYSFCDALWQFYALAVIFGLLYNGISFAAFGTLLSRWFVKELNLTTGIVQAGSGVFSAIVIPIIGKMSEKSWQGAYQTTGEMAFILIAVAILLLRNYPSQVNLPPFGVEATIDSQAFLSTNCDKSFRDAIHASAFWVFMSTFLLTCFMTLCITQNVVAYLSDIGYQASQTVWASSIAMVGVCIGKIGFGWLFGRFRFPNLSVVIAMIFILSPILLLVGNTLCSLYIATGLLGIAGGAIHIQCSHFVVLAFGKKDYPQIYSLLMVPGLIGAAVGPYISAYIFDMFGSYCYAWVLCSLLGIIVLFLDIVLFKKEPTLRNV